jgi:hypothetical protein
MGDFQLIFMNREMFKNADFDSIEDSNKSYKKTGSDFTFMMIVAYHEMTHQLQKVKTKAYNLTDQGYMYLTHNILNGELCDYRKNHDNDDIEIFEVDHPDTQRYKLNRIKELEWIIRPNVHFVSVDFEKESFRDKLLEAGFDPNKKTFFSILGVSYYLTLDTFADTLRQMTELSETTSEVVFDYPIKSGDFPKRVNKLEEITRSLGEVMCGGFDHNEIKCVLCSLGYKINTYLTPDKIQKEYFEGRTDNLKAFENVSLISATYTA